MDTESLALLAFIVSALTFILSFAQLIIQRIHNKKTVRPIGQIDLGDYKHIMYIYLVNNGIGPLIIKEINFYKGGQCFDDITKCLDIDPKSYNHVSINKDVSKSVLPDKHFVIAELTYTNETEDFKVELRKKLSRITIEIIYYDIYEKKYTKTRNLNWFARHLSLQTEE